MQYVRSISGSVSKTWNSINPATLSGAIDVIVVEHQDGSLACSPFHVRFGKFSLLRPSEKKVEFKVNDVKQDYPMKLGDGGEAFFVFETTNSIPEALQTSPLVSPVASPDFKPSTSTAPALPEPDLLELSSQTDAAAPRKREHTQSDNGSPAAPASRRAQSDAGQLPIFSTSLEDISTAATPPSVEEAAAHQLSATPSIHRANTDHALAPPAATLAKSVDTTEAFAASTQRPHSPFRARTDRSTSPPPLSNEEAMTRAINLSKKLWGSNIPSQITEKGDLMLDMTGYKSADDEALRAEVIARKILSEELEGNYDIGSLIGADEKGNLWIYSSEEAKEQAGLKAADGLHGLQPMAFASSDALSDPGYQSDDARSDTGADYTASHARHESDSAVGLSTPSVTTPDAQTAGDPNRNYAKTLRLSSDQLKSLHLKPGQNSMSFSVNRATCTANIWLWKHEVPIVISDIDGTITKSDALGHVLNMIGRDWTHLGVAKLYTDIAANGYNIFYLTSRSVGQADTTRAYLAGVLQEGGFKLPKGPVIMSPDRTIAALRREIYLRKPEIFKMACLRDIMALFAGHSPSVSAPTGTHEGSSRSKPGSPFYAGFGNRLTDALSYRSVNIPSTRIFTINSNSEVSLDLLTLNTYKTGYASMREIVDHFFPPVGLLVKGGGEEYTDFNYWRDKPLDIADFSASESEDEDEIELEDEDEEDEEDEDADEDDDYDDGDDHESGLRGGASGGRRRLAHTFSEDEAGDMADSYLSEPRQSIETDALTASVLESIEGDDAGAVDEEVLSPLPAEDDRQEYFDRHTANLDATGGDGDMDRERRRRQSGVAADGAGTLADPEDLAQVPSPLQDRSKVPDGATT